LWKIGVKQMSSSVSLSLPFGLNVSSHGCAQVTIVTRLSRLAALAKTAVVIQLLILQHLREIINTVDLTRCC